MGRKALNQQSKNSEMPSSSGDAEGEENQLHQFLKLTESGDLGAFKNTVELRGPGDELTEEYIPNALNALQYAALWGNVGAMVFLIEGKKLDINTKDSKGETPLHQAVKGGYDSAVVYLLDHGANPNSASDEGLTALHYAAEKGSPEVLHLLISKGAVVDAVSESSGTPLHHAASHGNKEAVEILLNHHACPDGSDVPYDSMENLHTPLGASIWSRSLECVVLLVEAGAKLNTITCGLTPLQIAAANNETMILKYLVEKGADATVTKGRTTPLELSGLRLNREAMKILFPRTPPLPCIPDWSISGVVSYFEKYKLFEELTRKATDALQRSEYVDAITICTEALALRPDDPDLLRQRSQCYYQLNSAAAALADAEASIKASPDMSLAYFSRGQAYELLEDAVNTADSYLDALLIDPDEKAYQDALWRTLDLEVEYMYTLRDLETLQFTSPSGSKAK